MNPQTLDPQCGDLEAFIEVFEAAQARGGEVNFIDFLPAPKHPDYLTILCELVRLDLEYGWQQHQPKDLHHYQQLFPELFRDPQCLQAIAFEEFRLRRRAGQSPSPSEYERCFGVCIAGWPSGEPATPLDGVPVIPRAGTGQDEESQAGAAQVPSQPANLSQAPLVRTEIYPEIGQSFLGFHLIGELGRGAFGRVFLAKQGDLANRLVVLKIGTGLVSESQNLAQLLHTHIVPIYSVHRTGQLQALCMPYLGATTLADVVQDLRNRKGLPESGKELTQFTTRKGVRAPTPGKPLPEPTSEAEKLPIKDRTTIWNQADGATPKLGLPKLPNRRMEADKRKGATDQPAPLRLLDGLSYVHAILWIGARLADGLHHAHERGILHRDLKPANVLLTDEGQPMLLDFNLSEDVKVRLFPTPEAIGGTLPYMSPEHLAALGGDADAFVEIRSDIYSVGVILYELLTGRLPYPTHKGSLDQMILAMIGDRHHELPRLRPWNKNVSHAVEAVVRKCLAPNPADRYQTARALQEDLDRHLQDQPLRHAQEPSLWEQINKWGHRHPRLTSSSGIAVVAAVLLAILWSVMTANHLSTAGAEAASALREFREDKQNVRLQFLTSRGNDFGDLQRTRGLCLKALERYKALGANWQEHSSVRNLSRQDQGLLREEMGELLTLEASIQGHLAILEPNLAHTAAALQVALQANESAQGCFDAQSIPQYLLLQRAELLHRLGREDEGRQIDELARSVTPRSAKEKVFRAEQLKSRNQYRAAIALLKEAIRQDSQDWWTWFVLGRCYLEFGEPSDAAESFTACLVLQKGFPLSYAFRGAAYTKLNKVDAALQDFEEALRLLADHPDPVFQREWQLHIYADRAAFRLDVNRPRDHVLEDLNRALELTPGSTFLYFLRARAKRALNDEKGAEADLQRARKEDPGDYDSCIARGLDRLGNDPEGALRDFEKALRFRPHAREALQDKASVLAERLNRTDAAISVMDELLDNYPDLVVGYCDRGVLLARLGRREEALKDAKACLKYKDEPIIQYKLACIYALTSRQQTSDQADAMRYLETALRSRCGLEWISIDTDLDPLRKLPEFERLAARYK